MKQLFNECVIIEQQSQKSKKQLFSRYVSKQFESFIHITALRKHINECITKMHIILNLFFEHFLGLEIF